MALAAGGPFAAGAPLCGCDGSLAPAPTTHINLKGPLKSQTLSSQLYTLSLLFTLFSLSTSRRLSTSPRILARRPRCHRASRDRATTLAARGAPTSGSGTKRKSERIQAGASASVAESFRE